MTRRGTLDHAVVLGGSIAGTLAARALSAACRSVTVIDRDRFPSSGEDRPGVPQGRHVHALQPSGTRIIEELVPGTIDELQVFGACLGDLGRDATICLAGQRIVPVETGLDHLTVSRPLLEGYLRTRLAGLPNVRLVERCAAHGLVLDDRGGAVAGVRVLPRADGSAEEVLRADLVVDATGRASRLPAWLEDVGFSAPLVRESGLWVSTSSARFPRGTNDRVQAIFVAGCPPEGLRAGGATAVEGEDWLVTLVGLRGEEAPTDRHGFVDYAATLPIPDLHSVVAQRAPLDDPVRMRVPSGQHRRYEDLPRLPGGLVVIGDAWCSFNPIYRQGLTVAAHQVVALRDCLVAGPHDVGRRFFRRCRSVVQDAWWLAVAEDARYLGNGDGDHGLSDSVLSRLLPRVVTTAAHDPVVAHRLLEVLSMVRRPTALLRPDTVRRVLARSA